MLEKTRKRLVALWLINMKENMSDVPMLIMEQDEFHLWLGRWIKEMRTDFTWTQEDFGKLIGMQPSQLSEVESGKRGLTVYQFYRVCQWLHDVPDAFF